MSTALFNLDSDGTLEILISRANIKKITRVMIAEPGRKTAKNFLLDTQPPESEWELNPGRCTCEHFRCKKCHFINCVAVKYCGEWLRKNPKKWLTTTGQYSIISLVSGGHRS